MADSNAFSDDIQLSNAKTQRRSSLEAHIYWDSVVIEEPISDNVKALVRAELIKDWHWERRTMHRDALRIAWATVDSERILLKDTTGQVKRNNVRLHCNKVTAFYWLQSAQGIDADGERTLMPKLILAFIHKMWCESYNGEPNIEFENFLASCVRVDSTGPSTIREIIDAHISLCRAAADLLSQDQFTESKKLQHYSLLPLYRSFIIVMDDHEYQEVPFDTNHRTSISEVADVQTVLLIRTGMETGLSAPISFDNLKSLQLRRSDLTGIDAVRVSLNTAVRWVIDLEKQEMSRNPRPHPPLDTSICLGAPYLYRGGSQVGRRPDTWADACIEAADEHGYNVQVSLRCAVRRVLARLNGEDVFPHKFDLFSGFYKP